MMEKFYGDTSLADLLSRVYFFYNNTYDGSFKF